MWKIVLIKFLILIFVIAAFPNALKADCTTDDSLLTVKTIMCDAQTEVSHLTSLTETKDILNIIPTYTDNNVYTKVSIEGGINIKNTTNHTLNISSSGSTRIDMEIGTLKSSEEETINIYGQDAKLNPSQLYIKTLNGTAGNLNINGESNNPITIDKATISGNISINNINLAIKNLQITSGSLTINGTNYNPAIIENAIISGNLFLNGVEVVLGNINIADITLNNSQLSLNDSTSIFIKDIYLNSSNLFIESSGDISAINGNSNANIYFNNSSKINVEDINIDGNIFLKDNAEVIVANKLTADNLYILNKASLKAGSMVINSKLVLNESLLIVKDSFEFLGFSGNSILDITINKPMDSQGNLTTGIYAGNDINLGTAKINLKFQDTYKIGLQESARYEILYSKFGNIQYSPYFIENNNDLFDIQYNILNGNGTSLIVEITRKASYCDVLDCSNPFSAYFLKYLEEDSPYKNIIDLINAIDNNPSNTAVLTLRPASNDILLLQSYFNNKLIINSKKSSDNTNFSIISNTGKTKDNIFTDSSNTQNNSVYYQQNFNDEFYMGIALNKGKIANNLYNADVLGALILSNYTLEFQENFIDFMLGMGANKYDKNKTNFNSNMASSTQNANNFLATIKLYRNYSFNKWQLTPNIYYNLQYSKLNNSTEKGSGLLYETKESQATIGDFNIGTNLLFSFTNKIFLLSSAHISYLTYSSKGTIVKPYELSEDYFNFNENNYSNIGYIVDAGVKYQIKENYGFSLIYTRLFYSNTALIDSVAAAFKYNF